MNQAQLRAPQESCKGVLSLAPVAGNGPLNGAGVDRTGYTSTIVDAPFAFAGGPTGGQVGVQLQDSADNVTFANYGAPVSVPVAAAGLASLAADLSGARQYVRAVITGTPTGGTTPAMTASATMRLYGANRLPAL